MTKLLRTAVGILVLGALFVLGWGFGEKNSATTDTSFVTQSVTSDTTKAQWKSKGSLELLVISQNTDREPLGTDPATKEVQCPGVEGGLHFSIPSHAEIKLTDKDGNEIPTHGFELSMVAKNATVPGKLIKAVLGKTPFDLDKCVYLTDNKEIVVLSIKLSDEFTELTDDQFGFKKGQ